MREHGRKPLALNAGSPLWISGDARRRRAYLSRWRPRRRSSAIKDVRKIQPRGRVAPEPLRADSARCESGRQLPRLRRAFLRALGEQSAAIAADDLDVKMLPEPISSHASGALRKEIEHLPSLQVHDCRPVCGALAPCPVIDTDDPRLPLGAALLYSSFDTAQDRIIACRHPHSLDQALSGMPAHAMAEKVNDFGRSINSSRSRSRHLGQLASKKSYARKLRFDTASAGDGALRLQGRLVPANLVDGAHAIHAGVMIVCHSLDRRQIRKPTPI